MAFREWQKYKSPVGAAAFLLCAFAKLRKATISFVMSVRPFIHMKQLGPPPPRMDFSEL